MEEQERKYGLDNFSTERLVELYELCKDFEKTDPMSVKTNFEIKKVIKNERRCFVLCLS